MKRKIITIDQDKCTGCGDCLPNCPEGAIQLIDGKARLIGDLFCDGLGACLGHCPVGAITIEERDAEPYDEKRVMANIVKQGPNTIKAHLEHLRDHQQFDYLQDALAVLQDKGIPNPLHAGTAGAALGHAVHGHGGGGCPGSRQMAFAAAPAAPAGGDESGKRPSQLTHWPLQLHLISPRAPHYQGSDLLLAADCTAFSLADFHKDFLKGRTLAVACPKLDEGQDVYVEKIKALIDEARINTLTVLVMQVPCCGGLLRMAQTAAQQATRKVPIKCVIVSLQGTILKEEWL